MKLKRLSVWIAGYLLLILMPMLIFSQAFLRDVPKLAVYEGQLDFSGDLAYSDLKEFLASNPHRYAGTEDSLSSAQYIENEFKEMGLKTIRQEFKCAGSAHLGILASLSQPDTDIPDNFFDEFSKYINDGFKKQNKGVNVIAVSPGKSDRVILVGAHRDNVPGCGTGAYDNASGTVSMLQIARVFSKIEHDHTFVFVSFDAEESGLEGSEAYVKKLADISKTDLALVFDMSGWKDGNSAAIYNANTNQGSSPLWIYALQQSIAPEDGGGAISAADFFWGNTSSLLWNYFREKAFSMTLTDTHPFIKKGVPAVGIFSDTDKDGIKVNTVLQESLIHSPKDTIENLGPAGLAATGRFAERFLRTVDMKGFFSQTKSKGLNTGNFVISNGKALYGPFVSLYWIVTIIILLLMAYSAVGNTLKNIDGVYRFLKSEVFWILGIISVSVLLGLSLMLFGWLAPSMLVYVMVFIGMVFTYILAIILFPVLRHVLKRKKPINSYEEYTGCQRLLLVGSYIVSGMVLAFIFNPVTAILYTGIPLVIFLHVRYKMLVSRVLWRIAAYIFFSIYPLTALLIMEFSVGIGRRQIPILSVLYFITIISVTYIVSVPYRQKSMA